MSLLPILLLPILSPHSLRRVFLHKVVPCEARGLREAREGPPGSEQGV